MLTWSLRTAVADCSRAQQQPFARPTFQPLIIPSRRLQGRMKATIEKQCAGWANWIVTWSEQEYIDFLADSKEQLVYLTADSTEEIKEVGTVSRGLCGVGIATPVSVLALHPVIRVAVAGKCTPRRPSRAPRHQ